MRYLTAADSTTGLREVNQDRYAEFNINGVKTMILCDGNGGHGGEMVAEYAVKFLAGEVQFGLSRIKQITLKKLQYVGQKAIKKTAEDIKNLKFLCPNFSSCGTTLTLVFIHNFTVITLWVGDSPAILFKNDRLTKLADPPHTLAEMLIAKGESRENIEKQPGLSSTLIRCIGFKNAEPGMSVKTCKPPFTVIIASDGIDYIPENKLTDIFDEVRLTECLPGKIIISALENGSSDNITVVATKVKAETSRKIRNRRFKRKKIGGLRYV